MKTKIRVPGVSPLVLVAIAASLVLACGAVSAQAADGHSAPKKPAKEQHGALSATEYVTMEPFVIPMPEKQRGMTHQYVLVLALKLVKEDARENVVQRIPRVRNALYPELYRLIAFRSEKQRVLDNDALRRNLTRTVLDAAGRDLVSDLVVHKGFMRDPP